MFITFPRPTVPPKKDQLFINETGRECDSMGIILLNVHRGEEAY